MNKIFAYVRKSKNTYAQKHDRQELILNEYARNNGFAIDEFVRESASGSISTENRKEYSNFKKNKLRHGDVLLLSDLDRLGRDADNIIHELKDLKQMGIRVVALDVPHLNQWENINNESIYNMVADIFISLKAHMSQQENEKRRERILQGLAVAKQKGTQLGRPKAILPPSFIKEYRKFKDGMYGEMTAVAFAKMLGLGRSTFYKYIQLID